HDDGGNDPNDDGRGEAGRVRETEAVWVEVKMMVKVLLNVLLFIVLEVKRPFLL
ncbi:hypothetical protein Tco_0572153, partial [Tanacetum coccineum]